jgi:hypothetical protein
LFINWNYYLQASLISLPYMIPCFRASYRHAAYLEARNTFPLPKIIFDLSLILSPYINLLGLAFADKAFLALSLILAARISKLDI